MFQSAIPIWAHKHIWLAWSPILFCYLLIVPLELLLPAERGQRYRTLYRNSFYSLLFLTVGAAAAHIATRVLGVFKAGPLLDLDAVIPKALIPFALLFVNDFFYYWFHRLQHSVAFLWRFHALHHSDEALNVTTSLRHHWIEDPLRVALLIFPMGFLFKMTPYDAGVISLIIGNWGYFIHANIRLDFGRFTPWLAGPQLHRVHHSIEPEHRDKNFAAYLPMYDVLFGTYLRPVGYPRTGVAPHAEEAARESAFPHAV